MITLFRQIHRYYSVLIILILSVSFYPFYYFASRKPERYALLNQLRKINSLLCSTLIGVFFRFRFEVPLQEGQTYIYCANHTSNLDIMILCVLAKGRFHFMGKQELLDNPVLKIFFQTIDVPVNRDSKISAFRAFKKVGENLENGMSLVIFPEGKIDDHYPPQLVPFKNGPFRLAIEKNIPIVPVSMTNVWQKMWDDGAKYGTSPGICEIYVHRPLSTKELNIDDSDLLKDRIFDLINSKLIH
ncbi:lysophospholipid acyltransferase family protein [Pedobacter sp. GR22-6]|uniref:lysophospholipid acyltransferase family protein n=1 Tax=Pedobacter sp. GR22-6 TaxID=3127957 RepID=UPI00307D9FD7